ncbi:hypothetical protein EA147_16355 [Providencia stuartii]|uniref:hypothetical protein n=1 Tax=Providencia stuartii TaxID=588 RepID=UPI000EF87DFA|nr:hypothetical protein [Providencia stuartii]RMA08740.1 hypothetical protein EA147_16355 [Providencia stuartii]
MKNILLAVSLLALFGCDSSETNEAAKDKNTVQITQETFLMVRRAATILMVQLSGKTIHELKVQKLVSDQLLVKL